MTVKDQSAVVDGTTVTFKKEASTASPPDLGLALALIDALASRVSAIESELERINKILRNHAIY